MMNRQDLGSMVTILHLSGSISCIDFHSFFKQNALSGKMFLAVMDGAGDRLQGNRLTFTPEGGIHLSPIWTFSSPGAKILRLVSKPTDEIVHSQGRVMADRYVTTSSINLKNGNTISYNSLFCRYYDSNLDLFLFHRSVLFKYINPNLGFVLAEGKDSSAKTFINVYLV